MYTDNAYVTILSSYLGANNGNYKPYTGENTIWMGLIYEVSLWNKYIIIHLFLSNNHLKTR